MNLLGVNINNSYLIRKKLHDDGLSDLWLCNSIFSTEKFVLKFIRKKKFENRKFFNEFKKEYIESKNISGEHIINFLEIDEFKEYFFISMEVPDGEPLSDFVHELFLKKDRNSLVKTLIALLDIFSSLSSASYPIGQVSIRDFWMVHNNKGDDKLLYLMDFKNHILNKYISDRSGNYNSNIKISFPDRQIETFLPGIISYQALTADFELNNLSVFLEKYKSQDQKKNGIGKIIYKMMNEYVENPVEIKNELMKLIELKKPVTREIPEYKDPYEERKLYFEALEKERRKRLESSVTEKTLEHKKTEVSLSEYNKRLFSERRFYFENNEIERWNYLKSSSKMSDDHIGKMIQHSKDYFEIKMKREINTDNSLFGQHKSIVPKFIGIISDQTKKNIKTLKKENTKYIDNIEKQRNAIEFNDKEYDEKRKFEAKKHLKKLINDSESYFNNISEVVKKDLKDDLDIILKGEVLSGQKNNSINASEKIITKNINKVEKIIDKTNKYSKKINRNKKEDELIHIDNDTIDHDESYNDSKENLKLKTKKNDNPKNENVSFNNLEKGIVGKIGKTKNDIITKNKTGNIENNKYKDDRKEHEKNRNEISKIENDLQTNDKPDISSDNKNIISQKNENNKSLNEDLKDHNELSQSNGISSDEDISLDSAIDKSDTNADENEAELWDDISKKESELMINTPYFWNEKMENILSGNQSLNPEEKEITGMIDNFISERITGSLADKMNYAYHKNKMTFLRYIKYIFYKLIHNIDIRINKK